MIKLLFGTGNKNKVLELKKKMGNPINLLSMEDVGITTELKETRDTIEGNAIQKVEQLYALYGGNCFSEDTGLCVPALNGSPGVNSARYAGPDKNDDMNIDKLLENLTDLKRDAYFLTKIALCWEGELYTFEGKCTGTILKKRNGEGGFGYDPVFQPTGFKRSFAEMTIEEKNEISHRAMAVEKFSKFLREAIL